jgi:hypothetical protein
VSDPQIPYRKVGRQVRFDKEKSLRGSTSVRATCPLLIHVGARGRVVCSD